MTVRLVLQRNSRISNVRSWIAAQWFFLITGLLAVGYAAFSVGERYVYQAYENRVFDSEIALRHSTPRIQVRPVIAGSLIGKIDIPRLNISTIIKEGVDDRILDLAAGHIPDTALPGQTGNVGVAAHRDTLFRNLKDVRRDDKITLSTLDGEYIYRVISTQIVLPTDVSVLDPSPNEKTLTLVTCYPFYFVGNAPKRFIVRALQVF
jgi:sortase A